MLDMANARPRPWLLAGLILALGICQGIPYLLSRVWVYEIAIGGGYFCIAAAIFFLIRGYCAASGLMFGMAIACRPHLVLAGLIALLGVAMFSGVRSRAVRAFAAGLRWLVWPSRHTTTTHASATPRNWTSVFALWSVSKSRQARLGERVAGPVLLLRLRTRL
jgi:hypothetical protein